MTSNLEKAAELLQKEDFVVQVAKAADQSAAIAIFKENGVTITAEELANLGTLLKSLNDNDGELPDEVAEQVAGGAFDITKFGSILGAIGNFLQGMEKPINSLVSLFLGNDTGGGTSGGGEENKQA